VIGLLTALAWGFGAGVVTSVPLGPTGALVIRHAARGQHRGALHAIAGLSAAQCIFAATYLFGFTSLLTAHAYAVPMLAFIGVGVTFWMGWRNTAAAWKRRAEEHLPIPVPSRRRMRDGFTASFLVAITNPFLLFFLAVNVGLYSEVFPNHTGRLELVALLGGGIFGTALWFVVLHLSVARLIRTKGLRAVFYAEMAAGVLMLSASALLAARLIARWMPLV
jgi:threonine/homoserine/homoserine lactone efflux protein